MYRHIRSFRRLLRKFGDGPIKMAEVGVARGELAVELLTRNKPRIKAYYAVDLWGKLPPPPSWASTGDFMAKRSSEEHEAIYRDALAALAPFRDRVDVRRMLSTEAATYILGRVGLFGLDCIFIDADHSYEGVRADLRAYWPLLRRRGLFCGHDYDHRRFKGVKKAVDEFAQQTEHRVQTAKGHIWYFRKK